MYDEHQHLDLFHDPGRYLFRGTLPSASFATPYQGVGITPTTIDPLVASLFASRYNMEGAAIVLIAPKSEFAELLDGPNLASFHYELAVNINLPPSEFEQRCLHKVTLNDSIMILHECGYMIPSKLPDQDALRRALQQSPRMLSEQISDYVSRCEKLPTR